MHNVLSLLSTSQSWPISSRLSLYRIDLYILPTISCFHLGHRGHCNVGQHQVQIISTFTSYPFFLIYIVDVVDIAMFADIDFTSYLHHLSYNLFTSLTLSTWKCWPASRQNCVYTASFLYCLLHCRHRRLCTVNQHRVDIVSTSYLFFLVYLVDIVDIAMLIDIESTSCLHSISFLSCLHHRHQMIIDFKSTTCLHCLNFFHLI